MKRKWWIVAIILAVIGVLWIMTSDKAYLAPLQTVIGLKPASVERSESKPVCSSPVNPNVAAPTDCIPQHLVNLPPDPGEAGKLTIDGIDSDKDGVRDDVQRWIAQNWGHSPRAVKALTIVAQSRLLDVHYGGDSLSKEEARKLSPELMRKAICTSALETEEMLRASAFEKVKLQVTNTSERWKRSKDFDMLFANGIFFLPDDTPTEACGFDPATLPN